jgi:hypothetical protein
MGISFLQKSLFSHSTIPSFYAAHQENGHKKYCDSNKSQEFRYIALDKFLL